MSNPLRAAACGATTLIAGGALALTTPGIAEARSLAETMEGFHVHRPEALAGPQQRAHTSRVALRNKSSLRTRNSRGERHARMLAALQRTIRKQRAQMIAQWDRKAQRAIQHALRQLGRPYVWGGTGETGYDCSGLVQSAWRRAGVRLPRVSHDQYRRTEPKVAREDLRPGDLVFFNSLGHVGMYLGDQRFVHAPRPGRNVTIERMKGWYQSRYVGAVRPGWKPLPEIPTRLW
ncbi:C40 family peptidase [Actinomadura kijaniata]|uniref:C40 family peptidase n=1 Tax=Actinomadura kijaniata TaxID=46161 RepID=UPI003F1BA431